MKYQKDMIYISHLSHYFIINYIIHLHIIYIKCDLDLVIK